MKRVFFIAEAGVNHNGDLDLARRMIDVAVEAGADAVKFQTAIPELVVTTTAEKAGYQKETTGAEASQLEMLKELHLPIDAYADLQRHCEAREIRFLSTAFDMVSLDLLWRMGMDVFKIPSGEITNLPYLRRIASFAKPVIMSTGMATLEEVGRSLQVLIDAGVPKKSITVLHCCTEYPTSPEKVNLAAMQTMARAFDVAVGYSDHTLGLEVSLAAVALGATVIEKHFTLDKGMRGPDHAASLEPHELKSLVAGIRNLERALAGDGRKVPTAQELENARVARRSIVAARPIKKGAVITADDIIAKRPGTGVSPMAWDSVLGTLATRDYAPDDLLELQTSSRPLTTS